jgi:hypothetical protein
VIYSLISGLFYDPSGGSGHFISVLGKLCRRSGVDNGQPWNVLCVYPRPEDVRETKIVDIRIYSSFQREANAGRVLSDHDLDFVQESLELWPRSYLNEFRGLLPTDFLFSFGSFHSSLIPAAKRAFDMPAISAVFEVSHFF